MRGMKLPLLLSRRTTLLSAGSLGLLALLSPARAAGILAGSGHERRETRNLPAFDALRLRGPFEVTLAQGASSVEVRGDDNLIPLVETGVVESGGRRVLELRLRDEVAVRTRSTLAVHASAPSWLAIAVEGSGDVAADGLSGDRIELTLVGSGDVRLRGLAVQAVAMSLSGSGDVRVAGTARTLSVSLRGSGDVWADDLAADDVDVSVAGSGDVRVHALRSLRAAVAGSGDVVYRGAPKLQISLAGSGRVTRR